MANLQCPTVWIPNNPSSLFDICMSYCVHKPLTFCIWVDDDNLGYRLRDGLALPTEICERMLEAGRTELIEEDFYKLLRVFANSPTRLQKVDLSNSPVRDSDLMSFLCHPISEFNLKGCKKLNRRALKCLSKFSATLQSLNLGSNPALFVQDPPPVGSAGAATKEDCISKAKNYRKEDYSSGSTGGPSGAVQLPKEEFFRDCIRIWLEKDELKHKETLKLFDRMPLLTALPLLRKLVIHDLNKTEKSAAFMRVVKKTSQLNHLDLSHGLVWDLEYFATHPLLSLVLYDVNNIKDCMPAIYEMKFLRHLDISSTEAHTVVYDNPNETLKTIMQNLVNLTSLDISGTNLAGKGTIERPPNALKGETKPQVMATLTDIPGLASRVGKPLEFLGLLNCAHQACFRHHIPAIRIAGDNGEEQILTAGQAYYQRGPAIQKVLNDLFSLFRFYEVKNMRLALDIIMEAMRLHLRRRSIQVAGSASLFYIIKSELKDSLNVKIKQKIIRAILDAMFAHYSDTTMLRNGCLAIIHFKVPEDMFFDYERFARLLLLIVSQEDQDDFVQRIGVYLLNSLACQVDGVEKKLVGDQGAIKIMLQLIEKRLEACVCDEVMETAWSTMWNVTDETPINCERFLEGKGMDLFLQCLDAFPSKPELLRNMIGLLGNVAEVKMLRTFLMKEDYLKVFSDLLDNRSDGIEVSYNAAGILSHIASDGPKLWTKHGITNIKREEVLQKMVRAIDSWDLNTKRNINYRSFKPILRLLSVHHTPEAQIWAVWALTNLTKVYPDKYCMLLKKEGGIPLLESLLLQWNPQIKRLAQMTIDHCVSFENSQDCEMADLDTLNIS